MSISSKTVIVMSLGVLVLGFGCAGTAPKTVTPSEGVPETRVIIPEPESPGDIKEPAPRTLASLRLIEQAEQLIASGRPDEAIRILEKSLNIDPGNGRNYYFLAEALILKGSKKQAAEFNRLAAIYLSADSEWTNNVLLQKERIEKMR